MHCFAITAPGVDSYQSLINKVLNTLKTITIDMEAYELLAAARRSNESFSTVIKNVLVPASHTAAALLHFIDSVEASADYLDAMEGVIIARQEDMIAAESPTPHGETRDDS